MAVFRWNTEKNQLLASERGLTFDELIQKIEGGAVVLETIHPNIDMYPNQKILIVNIDGYAYLVPFVRHGDEYFLKTIIPSRKTTRKHLRGEHG